MSKINVMCMGNLSLLQTIGLAYLEGRLNIATVTHTNFHHSLLYGTIMIGWKECNVGQILSFCFSFALGFLLLDCDY